LPQSRAVVNVSRRQKAKQSSASNKKWNIQSRIFHPLARHFSWKQHAL